MYINICVLIRERITLYPFIQKLCELRNMKYGTVKVYMTGDV